jgi:protoporphyrinogen oxidase
MVTPPAGIKVAIVGGGIAGLTAALRLAQSGCKVTVYEKDSLVGGNLGGDRDPQGNFHDVYPHMFGEWYDNFWRLVEDLGLSRERDFEQRPTLAFLRAGEFPNLKLLTNNGSAASALANLTSGIIPVPDMFLAAYSVLDILSQNFSGMDLRNEQTVNGFLTSRPYATEHMLKMHDMIITNIWAVNSYLTSAFAYQSFAKYQFRRPTPQCWVLKGDAYSKLISPLVERLKNLGCDIKTSAIVRHVTVKNGRIDRICVMEGSIKDIEVDSLILAVPPGRLAQLVMSAETEEPRSRKRARAVEAPEDGDPIVSVLPNLSELRRVRSEPIPVYDVAFKRRLEDVPNYYVALLDSLFEITFVDVSRPMSNGDNTVLAVAVSDFYSLPDDSGEPIAADVALTGPKPGAVHSVPIHHVDYLSTQAQQTAKFLILKELNRYVPFRLGEKWGDPKSDVDWDKSFYRSNKDHPLFINEVGCQEWTPKVWDARLPNVYFAGDYVDNPISIATVEAAVVSGLQAARELALREEIDAKIEIVVPESYPEGLMAFWKIALAPYAAMAKCWSEANVMLGRAAHVAGLREVASLPRSPAAMFAENATKASEAAIEIWKSMQAVFNPRRR